MKFENLFQRSVNQNVKNEKYEIPKNYKDAKKLKKEILKRNDYREMFWYLKNFRSEKCSSKTFFHIEENFNSIEKMENSSLDDIEKFVFSNYYKKIIKNYFIRYCGVKNLFRG